MKWPHPMRPREILGFISMKQFSIVAIIGLGGVAQAHLQAFDLLPDLALVAVCDVRKERSREYRQHNTKHRPLPIITSW